MSGAAEPEDIDLFDDLRAVVQPRGRRTRTSQTTLLFTSLGYSARFSLLKVSLGDQATLERRHCGCALERLGWTTHVSTIGATKSSRGWHSPIRFGPDRRLEKALPARFGGGPTDYQLVEGAGEDGQPRLQLVVDPAVGALDATALADAFL